jgi:hypothetical protein
VVPGVPDGYRLNSVSRQLTPSDTGFRTEYRATTGRSPVTLIAGGSTQYWPPELAKRSKIAGRTVFVHQDMTIFIAEVSDSKCRTILIFGIKKAELAETLKHLRCRKSGGELQAELRNRKRSEISFRGRSQLPYARLHFHISNVRTPEYFEITSEPCRCERFGVDPVIGAKPSAVAGRQVFVAPEIAPDGSRMAQKSIIWAPTSTALFTLNAPLDWDSSQIESVIRGVQEVDQATFTALLESNGIKEVSLLP